MLRNYKKIGWRNLVKQKGTTFISVFGLACAVGCCLVAYLFIEQVWFKGMLQPNKNEIYQLTYTAEKEEGKVTYGTVADPISELLPREFSHIKYLIKAKLGPSIVIHNLESFNQRAMFVDPGFMEMFSYHMEYGYSLALAKPDQVIKPTNFQKNYLGTLIHWVRRFL
jgi:putative ABC transport system permease protein